MTEEAFPTPRQSKILTRMNATSEFFRISCQQKPAYEKKYLAKCSANYYTWIQNYYFKRINAKYKKF